MGSAVFAGGATRFNVTRFTSESGAALYGVQFHAGFIARTRHSPRKLSVLGVTNGDQLEFY